MPPAYWMVTNRNVVGRDEDLGTDRDGLSYWTADTGRPTDLSSWTRRTAEEFRLDLIAAVQEFPIVNDPARHEQQKHVALFIHGYNNTWQFAVTRYKSLVDRLFSGPAALGLCVLFTWPSDGMPTNYLPDRVDAERSAPDLAEVLSDLYDHLTAVQRAAEADPDAACRAKVSMIAHSMGNFLLQRAMRLAWTRKNQPLLVSLLNQLLMVAADVDNDLFGSGESVTESDGDAIANLTYRVTALYTGRDPVLGLSAGFKHFGKRRLGRSGIDRSYPVPDNVWDVDCSSLFKANTPDIHGAYFSAPKTIELMRDVLMGIDRTVLRLGGTAPPGSA